MTSSRIVVRLALGVLFGVALVILPAVFSTGTLASTPGGFSTTQTFGPSLLIPQPGALAGHGSAPLSFILIILFIFLPSTICSFVIRRWFEKKARDYL